MKVEYKGLFSMGKGSRLTAILVTLMVISLIALSYFIFAVLRNSTHDQETLSTISSLRDKASTLSSLATDVVSGKSSSKATLGVAIDEIDAGWRSLQQTDSYTKKVLDEEYRSFGEVWASIKEQAGSINAGTNDAVFLDVVAGLKNRLSQINAENEAVIQALVKSRAPYSQIADAQQQAFLIGSLQADANAIGERLDITLPLSDRFAANAIAFQKNLAAISGSNQDAAISTRVEKMAELFGASERQIAKAINNDRQKLAKFMPDAELLSEVLVTMGGKVGLLASSRSPNSTYILISGLFFLVCLLILPIPILSNTTERLEETQTANKQNQTAILRLLDELADLADGDLTTTATVSEDFTGAIADSVNFTIDQLRRLVSRINTTAVKVSTAAQSTQQTALHLAEASDHQAQEIAGASAAINEMAVTIDQVSANAAESASVAERSVSIANNGAKVVQNTIHGMDTIREQIQDTSKRIKRLGESSQEIGDIVSLINDIADQTNILALNAAIQASMAGDAGRGFAVVADEVQRLAERSAAATKQIEALVKTIQTDTNEAVISMEQTTTEVVNGARLAQDAGVALEEIEGVSANLAELIQNISNAARQQASSAGHISNTMNVIQEITSQTSAGTGATAQSIGELAEMALDLRESVAGFTLPSEYANQTDGAMGSDTGEMEEMVEDDGFNFDDIIDDDDDSDENVGLPEDSELAELFSGENEIAMVEDELDALEDNTELDIDLSELDFDEGEGERATS